LSQRHTHCPGQQQGVHLRLAPQDACGHRKRQFHNLALYLVEIPVALLGKILDQLNPLTSALLIRHCNRRRLCFALRLLALGAAFFPPGLEPSPRFIGNPAIELGP
jgi:hypothetical protein